jgi:hypothetical protein
MKSFLTSTGALNIKVAYENDVESVNKNSQNDGMIDRM